ncbi:MAG: SIMPL domain-containing protein [Bryobacteraceae bacterium]
MKKLLCSVAALCFLAPGAQAQVRRPFIRALGQGSVSVQPDLAKIHIGVVTQASTAQDASTQNATKLSAVLSQLRQVLGSTAEIKTVNYTLTVNYTHPNGGGAPVLNGYTATNIVEVSTTDLTIVGKAIDTATQAGANNIQSLQFTLKDDQPARMQALKAASQQAKAHAEAIASGVGARTGAVLALKEDNSRDVTPLFAALSTATPVQPGALVVTATVTLDMELIQ